MDYRNYDPEKDRDAAHRILREVSWLEKGKEEPNDLMIKAGRALVVDVRGEPERIAVGIEEPGHSVLLQLSHTQNLHVDMGLRGETWDVQREE